MAVSNEGFKFDEDILVYVPDEFKPYREYLKLMIKILSKTKPYGKVIKWRKE